MTTVTIKGIVHLSAHGSISAPHYVLYSCDMSEFGHASLSKMKINLKWLGINV